MDKNYWDEYYLKHGLDSDIQKESTFASFCQTNFFKDAKHSILEIGSGNGRDSKYFATHGHNVIAIDQSHSVETLNTNHKQNNIYYQENNFVSMDYSEHNGVNIVYSRFTLHAITLKDENIVLNKIYNLLDSGGMVLIEARSIKDPLYGQGKKVEHHAYITTHYRRFIDSIEFIQKMLTIGFKLRYFTEENNLSVYKDDNPYLIRAVFEK